MGINITDNGAPDADVREDPHNRTPDTEDVSGGTEINVQQ
jgi:hypothetical protein